MQDGDPADHMEATRREKVGRLPVLAGAILDLITLGVARVRLVLFELLVFQWERVL